jgi:hypothetical protein
LAFRQKRYSVARDELLCPEGYSMVERIVGFLFYADFVTGILLHDVASLSENVMYTRKTLSKSITVPLVVISVMPVEDHITRSIMSPRSSPQTGPKLRFVSKITS